MDRSCENSRSGAFVIEVALLEESPPHGEEMR
jgi:hypothetical protein